MKKVTNTTTVAEQNPAVWLLMCLPGGIEASEVRGQAELVESSILPSDMRDPRTAYEALGFRFGEPVDGDPLFVQVDLPAGWKKSPSDHAMWSYIVDDKGRQRVRIFYKAAFYDRRASMSLAPRYAIDCEYSKPSYDVLKAWIVDNATGETIWSKDGDTAEEARAWLDANRPDHRDPAKSWEGV